MQQRDQRRSQLDATEAAYRAATASLDAANASADAARADVARIQSQLSDAVLVAPRRGRVEYKLVQSGEVVAAGAPIATLLDLADVYMTVFVPAKVAGRLRLETRRGSFSIRPPNSPFRPRCPSSPRRRSSRPRRWKRRDEREKLMFRVKLRIAPALLKQYEPMVKIGVRGMAYVRTGHHRMAGEPCGEAAPMSEPAVRLAGVVHRYGTTFALDGADLEVPVACSLAS